MRTARLFGRVDPIALTLRRHATFARSGVRRVLADELMIFRRHARDHRRRWAPGGRRRQREKAPPCVFGKAWWLPYAKAPAPPSSFSFDALSKMPTRFVPGQSFATFFNRRAVGGCCFIAHAMITDCRDARHCGARAIPLLDFQKAFRA